MRILLFLSLFLFIQSSFKPKPAYTIFYGKNSKSTDYGKMIKGIKDADVVFFGESHNNPMCHWLELQVLKSLTEDLGKSVVVGAEMFEADDQLVLDEYLNGLIEENRLLAEAKVWDNYKTDYAPIVNYAKEHNQQVIATNIPRRYAAIVARNGFNGLEKIESEGKAYIAPLPIEVPYELPSYQEMTAMMGGHGHGLGTNMIDAQAIKDATMAHFIDTNLSQGSVFYHINGSFHSKNKEGIVHYLKQLRPDLEIITITTVDQEQIEELEEQYAELADYIIAIPSDMTKTY